MNWVAVSRAGQPRLCPMPGREVGGEQAEARPAGLPGGINSASGGDCRTRLPLLTAQQPSVGSSGQDTALLSWWLQAPCLSALPGDPPLVCHLFPQDSLLPRGPSSPASEQHRQCWQEATRVPPGKALGDLCAPSLP